MEIMSELLIGGRWRAASNGATLTVLDPSDGTPIMDVANASVDDCRDAVEAAWVAGSDWARCPPRDRSEILRTAFTLMVEERDEIAELIVRENGKVLRDALNEVTYAAEFFRWYAEEAVRIDGDYRLAPSGLNRIIVTREPVGVSVLVTPWNFPAAMATRKIAPALAAGCTVVLKPASETPLTALALGDLLMRAGVPAGVVNVVPSSPAGPSVEAMLSDDRVRKLSFTGSTEVGRTLLAHASQRVLNCSMELGGNAPFLVFADADIEAAVAGALVAKMRNGGAACTAANRMYAHRDIAGEFGERLAQAMGSMLVGPGLEPGVEMGPLVSEAERTRVSRVVADSLQAGARALTGATVPAREGYFYAPTVLVDVPYDSELLRDEIFGPVAPIVAFESVDQAVGLANATHHGLVSYLYTSDMGVGMQVAERLESGMIALNRGLVSDPAAPFGGVKQSGLGREGGHDGLLEFLETKYIAASWQ